MPSQKRYDIFLSHNSKDKPLVEILAEQLRDAALEVWLDQDNLYGGDVLSQEIERAITNSKTVLFCIGGHGLGKWQQFEMNICRGLSIDERLKIISVVLPPLESLPEETEYLALKQELYLKWKIGDSNNLERLIYSVSQWLPIWREKELKRLTKQRNDAEKQLQEIEQNIQQVEREIGIEVDPYRQKAAAWISSTRKRVDQYARKILRQFPKLDERIKEQEGGFEFLCIELDTCLEFIYFAFRKRDHLFLNDLYIEFSVIEFESEDQRENREIYQACLNMISELIPCEVVGEELAGELRGYFNYLCTQVISLI
jgi:hypothetical protein